MKKIVSGLCLAIIGVELYAHESTDRAGVLSAFNWDFDATEIRSEKIADNFYVLFGLGGNIAVTIGEQGVLIVDDQFPELMPKIKAKIEELGGENGYVDFAINTHWHFDHADGNMALGKEGTWIVSHINSRHNLLQKRNINLVSVTYDQEPYPEDALPVITYEAQMQFHFNGERIDLLHPGYAHTTGDTAVIFRGHNAVHMGDVYNAGYPFIDADNGGSLTGVIDFCQAVLDELNEDSIVGPVGTYQDLKDYVAMLTTIRERMVALINKGASLEEVIAAEITKEWDTKKGDPIRLLDRSYRSLTR